MSHPKPTPNEAVTLKGVSDSFYRREEYGRQVNLIAQENTDALKGASLVVPEIDNDSERMAYVRELISLEPSYRVFFMLLSFIDQYEDDELREIWAGYVVQHMDESSAWKDWDTRFVISSRTLPARVTHLPFCLTDRLNYDLNTTPPSDFSQQLFHLLEQNIEHEKGCVQEMHTEAGTRYFQVRKEDFHGMIQRAFRNSEYFLIDDSHFPFLYEIMLKWISGITEKHIDEVECDHDSFYYFASLHLHWGGMSLFEFEIKIFEKIAETDPAWADRIAYNFVANACPALIKGNESDEPIDDKPVLQQQALINYLKRYTPDWFNESALSRPLPAI